MTDLTAGSALANHRTLWTREENRLLRELWDPSAVEAVAAVFGRTVKAVTEHHYELLWGTAHEALAKQLVTGRCEDRPSRRRPDRPAGKLCPSCHTELAVSGECGWC